MKEKDLFIALILLTLCSIYAGFTIHSVYFCKIDNQKYYITDKKCDNLYMDFVDNTEKVYRICIK